MSVKRVPKPIVTRRRPPPMPKSSTQIMPFYIERVRRNQDLFQLTTDSLLQIKSIRINIREMIGGPYRLRIILEAKDGILTSECTVSKGMNSIKFPHDMHEGETLRFDFHDINDVYKNVSGVTGSIVLRS